VQERVASGLPSVFNPATGDVTGPHDLAFRGRRVFLTVGWGGDPAARTALGAVGREFDALVEIGKDDRVRVVADLGGKETAENPAGGPLDSNPFGLLREHDDLFVADAGANDLLRVGDSGRVRTVATFAAVTAPPPFLHAEPVPTAVERGPDDALYVSELTGVPFTAGAAGIYRIDRRGNPTLFAGGLKMVTDFTFAGDGSIYAVEYATSPLFLGGPGALVHIARDGTQSVVTTALRQPTSVTVGPDGSVYVSENGGGPGLGDVVRIDP
jgi:hypothetical protein